MFLIYLHKFWLTMKARNLIIIVVFLLSIFYMAYRIFRNANIDKEINSQLVENTVLLDVRTAWEYNRGNLPNSLNIKMSDLRTVNIPFDKDRVVITYCSHGMRSIKAKGILKKRGFTNVYNGGSIDDLEPYFKIDKNN